MFLFKIHKQLRLLNFAVHNFPEHILNVQDRDHFPRQIRLASFLLSIQVHNGLFAKTTKFHSKLQGMEEQQANQSSCQQQMMLLWTWNFAHISHRAAGQAGNLGPVPTTRTRTRTISACRPKTCYKLMLTEWKILY